MLQKETIFQSALIATQKRVQKTNIDLFNSHKPTSSHGAKINLNAQFRLNHYGLNSVLRSALELWDTNAFKVYRKKLLNDKGVKLLKGDFEVSSIKKLFNTIDFVVSYDSTTQKVETRNSIFRLKKIEKDMLQDCSIVSGVIKLFGKEFELKNEFAYFEKEVSTKDGKRYDYYTIIPKDNFTLWGLLGMIEKFKLLELKKEKETSETK